jgi:hypothetical protein
MSSQNPADGAAGDRRVLWVALIAIAAAHSIVGVFAFEPGLAVSPRAHLGSPLSGLAFAISWLAPGFLALLPRSRRTFPATVLLAAPVAFVIHLVIASAVKWTLGTPASPMTVLGAQLAVEVLLGAVAFRGWQNPAWTRDDRRAAWAFVLICAASSLCFAREIWLREFSSDGLESLDMGASLAWFHLPRTPTESGLVGLGVGMIAQAFPAFWCATIAGAVEAAPRLPLVIFLPVVLMGVAALSERGASLRLSSWAYAAAGAGILCGAAMLGMNASFDPYHADVASPAALDVMTVAMMLGVVWAGLGRRLGWLLLCAGIAHFCRPSGLLLLLVFAIATCLVDRGARLRRSLPIAAAVLFCAGLTFLYERVYVPRVIEGGALGLESGSLLGRLRYLNFSDWQRLVIVAFASGIFPWLAFVRPRRLDADGRVVALIAMGMFAFFLLPASYAPHHFAPVFVLVQIPFWRRWLAGGACPRTAIGAFGLAVAALVALFPSKDVPEPFRAQATSIRIETTRTTPLARGLLREAELLERFVALPWSDADPARQLVGSPLVLAWYGSRPRGDSGGFKPTFIVQDERRSVDDFERIAAKDGLVILATESLRARPLSLPGAPTGFGRALFRVPRERLFASLMVRSRTYDIDLGGLGRPRVTRK